MIKVFGIDYVREALTNKLASFSSDFFTDEDIVIYSFYEHLISNEEVQRYVEKYRDISNIQNRDELVGFGIIAVSDTPTITNIRSAFISPFEWACNVRTKLENRDKVLATCYELIDTLKGRKVDIAQLNTGKLQVVGTIDNEIKNYDFIGEVESATFSNDIKALITSIKANGTTIEATGLEYLYAECNGVLKLYKLVETNWVEEVGALSEHTSFEKYKVDLGFDDVKCTEPYTLNSQAYCDITFGGTATIVNASIRQGNDMVKLFIGKNYVITGDSTTFDFKVDNKIVYTELEPLELSSGNNSNNITNQLRSNFFKSSSHTDSIALTLQYSFICDMGIDLIKNWFDYARYGECNLGSNNTIQSTSITPNIVYSIKELWSSWGEVEVKTIKTKIVNDINIENTESDTMSMTITMQIQGDND